MDPARRFMYAGLAVAAVEAVLGLVALRTGLAPYLCACAAATVLVAVGGSRLMTGPPPDDDAGDGGSPGPPPDDDPPPPWWPEFERAFRRHADRHDRPRHPVH